MRVWFNGRIGAFQAFDAGSIPATRSSEVPAEIISSSEFMGSLMSKYDIARLVNHLQEKKLQAKATEL